MGPIVRVVGAGIDGGPLRLVVSGVEDPEALRAAWAASGSTVAREGDRLTATSSVEALARAAGRALGTDEAATLEASAQRAAQAWAAPTPALELPGGALPLDATPAIMGVLNCTPDSFHDGGVLYPGGHPEAAVGLAREMVAAGAAIVDVGGESTRPGADPVSEADELERTVPVVEALAALDPTERPIVSIDTMKAEVARQALRAGATLVNDVSGGPPELLDVVAEAGAGYVLMHRRGTAKNMQQRTDYGDVVAEVYDALADGLERCAAAGISEDRVVVDPGIGFAKTVEQNLALLRAVPQLRCLGRPVLIGVSRKSFIGHLLDGAPTEERLEGSLACAALATADGAGILRVHDVGETYRTLRVAGAVAGRGRDATV